MSVVAAGANRVRYQRQAVCVHGNPSGTCFYQMYNDTRLQMKVDMNKSFVKIPAFAHYSLLFYSKLTWRIGPLGHPEVLT